MKLSTISLFICALFIFSACEKGNLFKKDGKDEKDFCFELIYPITYNLPDGTSITGDEKEIWEDLKAWYEANEDSEEKPTLQYPVEIKTKEGEIESIADEDAMIIAKMDCEKELEICDWDGSAVADDTVWDEDIVEPLVTSDACGDCIVEGIVKYTNNESDAAFLIYYGKGECDDIAHLVKYPGKDLDEEEGEDDKDEEWGDDKDDYFGIDKDVYKCIIELGCDTGGN